MHPQRQSGHLRICTIRGMIVLERWMDYQLTACPPPHDGQEIGEGYRCTHNDRLDMGDMSGTWGRSVLIAALRRSHCYALPGVHPYRNF